ncbi:SMP-30/gluconolactonase/LRE family protein [Pseudonocardia sp. GCM10023141]|uniref:SMP-30/gluconolactonase/LRE family protein n=1 Tax=Pseudonocardia sp. GCM10023141 TaxID=3252653 RepID=UPI0036100A08
MEGLRWQEGGLWSSDSFTKAVKRFAADGSHQTVVEVEGSPSGLGFLPDGSVLVVSQADKSVLKVAPDGTPTVHADFSQFAGGIGNDMLVTKAGHAYVGNLGFALGEENPETTRLVHVGPSVRNPGAWSDACAFGGDDLDTLYMTCNTTTVEEFNVGKSSAAIATAKVGRKGSAAA